MGAEQNNKPAKESAKLAKAGDDPKQQPWWFNQALPIDRFTGWLVAWTCILSIATLGLGIAAFFQWRELHKTDETLRKTLVISQRAWIAPSTLNVAGTERAGKNLQVQIGFSNVGNSPAIDLRVNYLPKLVEPTTPGIAEATMVGANITCDTFAGEKRRGVTFPGQQKHFNYFTVPASYITEDVLSGKMSLALQGCFEYETMGETHYSKFCMLIFFGGQAATRNFTVPCGDGNDAD